MTDPTVQQIICHNIVTAINGNDSNGNLSFDANLLHASPVAEHILLEIVTEYRYLLGLLSTSIHPNYQDDIRDMWGPLKLVLSEFAYRAEPPTVTELGRFVSTFVPSDNFAASAFIGKHPNRIVRALNTFPRDIDSRAQCALVRTIATIVSDEEIARAHAAVVKSTSTFTLGFTLPLINADEFRVMRERYSDGMIF